MVRFAKIVLVLKVIVLPIENFICSNAMNEVKGASLYTDVYVDVKFVLLE